MQGLLYILRFTDNLNIRKKIENYCELHYAITGFIAKKLLKRYIFCKLGF